MYVLNPIEVQYTLRDNRIMFQDKEKECSLKKKIKISVRAECLYLQMST